MRPTAVRQAEWVYLAAVATMIATVFVDPAAASSLEQTGWLFAIGVTSFFVGLYLFLLLFATRKGRGWARIGLVLLTLSAVALLLFQVGSGGLALGLVGVLNTLQTGLLVVGAVLLFRPAAKAWFAKPHPTWEEDA